MLDIAGPYSEFILSIATGLAADLIKSGAGRLRAAAWGDKERQALQRAWERGFAAMLAQMAADLPPERVSLLDDIFRRFINDAEVRQMLLEASLGGQRPDLHRLQERFDLAFERRKLGVSFRKAMQALTAGLSAGLLDAAAQPDSPLYNRVSLVRLVGLYALLDSQGDTLERVDERLGQIERELARLGQDRWHYLGPVSGYRLGEEGRTSDWPAELRPSLERLQATVERLTKQNRYILSGDFREANVAIESTIAPAPYTPDDRAAYLQAIVDHCKDVRLPYAAGDRASLPLREIYVALRADRSSPVEREASFRLFQRQAEGLAGDGPPDDVALARLVLLDPYAARFFLEDDRLEAILAEERRAATQRTYDLAELIRDERWLVLLGHPGTGKSTLARWLALQLALALQANETIVRVRADHVRPDGDPAQWVELGPARLPVLVSLAEYVAARWPEGGADSGLSLGYFLGRHLGQRARPGQRPEQLHALIRDYQAAGRVTFILDGLDEVVDLAQRQAVAAAIEALVREWATDEDGLTPLDPHPLRPPARVGPPGEGNQIVVTSRIIGYHLRPLPGALPHYVIQPMDDTAVRRFCDNWAAATGLDGGGEPLATAALKHANAHVRDQMARNPLLLTILAQVYSGQPARGLPSRRAALYAAAERAVFGQRRDEWGRLASRLARGDTDRALGRVTAEVAYRLHDAPDQFPAALVDEATLSGWLGEAVAGEPALLAGRRAGDVAGDVLRAATQLSGFFVARGQGAYGFLHRQFQEYFAARALLARCAAADGGFSWGPLLARLDEPAWYEVILLAAGLVEEGRRDATLIDGALPARAAVGIIDAVLDAPDSVGSQLPRNSLLAAAMLREMEVPPAAAVRSVAGALIDAYRRDDPDRQKALAERVRRAFIALPRTVGRSDPVGEALCAALTIPGYSESNRFQRLAAAEMLLATEWYTPITAEALSRAWRTNAEPAGTLLIALGLYYRACPDCFTDQFLPSRAALAPHMASADQYPHWQTVLRTLYLAPGAPLEVASIVRDSPLTAGFVSLFNSDPADVENLRSWLRGALATGDDVQRRDAALALASLGDMAAQVVTRIVMPDSVDYGDNTPQPWVRAIFSCLSTVLALSHNLDRDIEFSTSRVLNRTNDLVRDLNFESVRYLTDAADLATDLIQTMDGGLDLTFHLSRIHAFAHAHNLVRFRNLSRIRNLEHDLDLTLAQAQAHALELDLQLDLDLALEFALIRDLDFALARLVDPIRTRALAAAVERYISDALRHAQDPEIRAALQSVHGKAHALSKVLGTVLGPARFLEMLDTSLASRPLIRRKPKRRLVGEVAELTLLTADLSTIDAELLTRLDGRLLVRLVGHYRDEARRALSRWLADAREDVRRAGALLLAEMGEISPASLSHLAGALDGDDDLPRYRAQVALPAACNRPASAVGREALEALADLASDGRLLVHIYAGWSLKNVIHDMPGWLAEWAVTGRYGLLGRINRLGQDWSVYRALLRKAPPARQVQLLDSAGWLLRLTAFKDIPVDFKDDLLTLVESSDTTVRRAALAALSHWPRPDATLARRLQNLPADEAAPVLYVTMARLVASAREATVTSESGAWLLAALPRPGAAAALLRLRIIWLGRAYKDSAPWPLDVIPLALLDELAEMVPDLAGRLAALLESGTNDDLWGIYHERVADLFRRLAEQEGETVGQLLASLGAALDEDEERWPRRRIVLAALAGVAAALPDALNDARPRPELDELLCRGTEDPGSFSARRFAVTTLSHLRLLSPAALAALLRLSRDVPVVQADAIAAARRFTRLDPAWALDDSLDEFAAALTGPSAAAAYTAAQLLGALGSGPAVGALPGLRRRIAATLSEALRHLDAGRTVYLLQGDTIIERGTLAEALYAALVEVWGLP